MTAHNEYAGLTKKKMLITQNNFELKIKQKEKELELEREKFEFEKMKYEDEKRTIRQTLLLRERKVVALETISNWMASRPEYLNL